LVLFFKKELLPSGLNQIGRRFRAGHDERGMVMMVMVVIDRRWGRRRGVVVPAPRTRPEIK
jgi:hypothetical protein